MPIKSISGFNNDSASLDNFFNGSYNLQRDTGLEFDPLITGFAFFIWTHVPVWVTKEYKNFEAMTQKNFKNFSGINDLNLAVGTMNQGFNNNEYAFASGMDAKPTEFSITHQEFSGSPIKNMYQYWVTGIRDPQTGIATYPRVHNLDYSAKNHTGELIYIMTRPDANNVEKKNIEFAAYWTNVFPTKLPIGHFNYSMGTQDPVEIEMNFRGMMHISPKVDEYASEILKTTYAFRSEAMFDPESSESASTIGEFDSE